VSLASTAALNCSMFSSVAGRSAMGVGPLGSLESRSRRSCMQPLSKISSDASLAEVRCHRLALGVPCSKCLLAGAAKRQAVRTPNRALGWASRRSNKENLVNLDDRRNYCGRLGRPCQATAATERAMAHPTGISLTTEKNRASGLEKRPLVKLLPPGRELAMTRQDSCPVEISEQRLGLHGEDRG